MAETRPLRVLLADDHIVVRTGLVSIIQARPDMTVVAEAVSGEQAIELYRRHRPDLVLMDLRMPGLDGVEAMKSIRGEFRDARFLVLTMYRRDEDVYRAFCAGALGYVLKSASSDELIAAVRAVGQGRRYIPPACRASRHWETSAMTCSTLASALAATASNCCVSEPPAIGISQ